MTDISRELFNRADFILAVVFLSDEAGDPPLGLTPAEYYVGTRAAPLGPLPGAAIGAVFGTINPKAVALAAGRAWTLSTPAELLSSREEMAVTVLERVLGRNPHGLDRACELLRRSGEAGVVEGHPLYAGLLSLDWPDDPLAQLWRAADLVREHRGGSHVNAFRAAGLDGAEINVLTELWRGIPLGSESRTVNAWSRDDIARALESLTSRGFAQDESITDDGKRLRDEIESATGRQEREIVDAISDDIDELFAEIDPMVSALRDALRPPYWWHKQQRADGDRPSTAHRSRHR